MSHLVQLLCAAFFLHSQLRCSLPIGILQSFDLIGHIEVISVERRLKSSFNSQMYFHSKDVIYILAILGEVLDSPYFCSSAVLCSFVLFSFLRGATLKFFGALFFGAISRRESTSVLS